MYNTHLVVNRKFHPQTRNTHAMQRTCHNHGTSEANELYSVLKYYLHDAPGVGNGGATTLFTR